MLENIKSGDAGVGNIMSVHLYLLHILQEIKVHQTGQHPALGLDAGFFNRRHRIQ